jgi:hypothetical protein
VKPISNGAGRTPRNPQPNGIEKLFEKGNEAFIIYDCKTKNEGNSRNTEFFTIVRKQDKRSRGLLWLCPIRNQRKERTEKSAETKYGELQTLALSNPPTVGA